MHVADFAVRRIRDFFDVIRKPAVVAKAVVVPDRLDFVDLRPLHGRFRVDGNTHFLAAAYLEIFIVIVRYFEFRPVDCKQVISFMNVEIRTGQRRRCIGVEFGGTVDFVESVITGFLVGNEVCAKPTGVDGRQSWSRSVVTAGDVGVRNTELAHHLRHDPIQLLTRVDPGNVRPVSVADGFPVAAMHVRIVKEIPVPPPAVVEYLRPFLPIIESVQQSAEAYLFAGTFGGKRLIECRHIHVVLFADRQLLAIWTDIIITDLFAKRRVFLRSHIVHHQLPLCGATGFENFFVLSFRELVDRAPSHLPFSRFEVEIIPCRHGKRICPLL